MRPDEIVTHLTTVLDENDRVHDEAMTYIPLEYQAKIREMRRDRAD